MTVRELTETYIEGSEIMEIWDMEQEKEVFRGTFNESVICEYSDEDVRSFEVEDGIIVINI